MNPDRNPLALAFAVTVGWIALLTVVFLGGVWAITFGVFSVLGVSSASTSASLLTAVALCWLGVREFRQVTAVERLADARTVTPDECPTLYRLTTRVAAQLDVPPPTIALADSPAPQALVVGLRPGNVHLVLSTGVIDALGGDDSPVSGELEAVIAHELAHVANRDAMVMTVASVPVLLASRPKSWALSVASETDSFASVFLTAPIGLLSGAVWLLGRATTARLSRARERVADRTAVEVTGSASALAGALATLDDEIDAAPDRDLRTVSALSSLSILPLEPSDPVLLGPDGERKPPYWRVERALNRLFRTHPPTADRVDSLATLVDRS
ncbi:Zn-dependent protease with chaperone function [Halovivax ruber XH-70]|uniref:Zn-dependent protease with chaperone function n=1 Tax=Halovivax ruber (strain DSM 18193 / JCM 13892 / XH-70) TaxID=797302 RepID=L0I5N2_HALRX|nr:M48 family metalloprotease [Halovivax ruber]AGB14815.1 Zn-dependent protease with chaperone function [Halovivax ruber XH-70]